MDLCKEKGVRDTQHGEKRAWRQVQGLAQDTLPLPVAPLVAPLMGPREVRGRCLRGNGLRCSFALSISLFLAGGISGEV